MKKIYAIGLLALLLAACKPAGQKTKADDGDTKPVITVTIEPLRYFTEAIAGDRLTWSAWCPKAAAPKPMTPPPPN